MFKSIGILLLTLLLVSCAGRPDFDVRPQQVMYKDLTEIMMVRMAMIKMVVMIVMNVVMMVMAEIRMEKIQMDILQ